MKRLLMLLVVMPFVIAGLWIYDIWDSSFVGCWFRGHDAVGSVIWTGFCERTEVTYCRRCHRTWYNASAKVD